MRPLSENAVVAGIPTADDLGHFGVGGHQNGFAQSIEHFLEPIFVGHVFIRVFEFRPLGEPLRHRLESQGL